MVPKTRDLGTRRGASPKHAPNPAGPFKPLAIPAVAAAVGAGATAQARMAVKREIPAVLRQDDFVD
jgi:hypothetical protein